MSSFSLQKNRIWPVRAYLRISYRGIESIARIAQAWKFSGFSV